MSKKTKQIIAIVALVFMGVFTVTFILWLAAPRLLHGQFGYWALFSGAVGIGLFLLVKLIKSPEEKAEQEAKADYLSDEAREEKQKQLLTKKNASHARQQISTQNDATEKTESQNDSVPCSDCNNNHSVPESDGESAPKKAP